MDRFKPWTKKQHINLTIIVRPNTNARGTRSENAIRLTEGHPHENRITHQAILFALVVNLIMDWFLVSVHSQSLSYHFLQLTFLSEGLRAHRSFLKLRMYPSSTVGQCQIKLCYYRWMKTMNISLVTNYHNWWSNPLTCLSIV
jgi:hypothetical protein